MSHISADDVRKVAKLARLNLPDDKIATYTGQLESILGYVSQLEQVDTTGVPETTSCGSHQCDASRRRGSDACARRNSESSSSKRRRLLPSTQNIG